MPRRPLLSVALFALLVIGCVSADVVAPETECGLDAPNVALTRAATASEWLDEHRPSLAVDGSDETYWDAGAHAQQWIEIDLGESVAISCVRVRVHQDEGGESTHRINGGAHVNPGRELGTLEGQTEDRQWLQIEGQWEFQFLRITTLESASTVGWYEIEVR